MRLTDKQKRLLVNFAEADGHEYDIHAENRTALSLEARKLATLHCETGNDARADYHWGKATELGRKLAGSFSLT